MSGSMNIPTSKRLERRSTEWFNVLPGKWFEHSKHNNNIAYTREVQHIKNLRLSCKRLCGTSSSLLLPSVDIDFTNPKSIRRLHEISLHPGIGRGVRVVKVALNYYDSVLANNFSVFAEYYASRMEASGSVVGEIVPRELDALQDELREKATSIVSVWRNRHPDLDHGQLPITTDSCQEVLVQNALRRSYEDYQKLYGEQERQRADGSLLTSVATATARMPLATNLVLSDDPYYWLDQLADDRYYAWGIDPAHNILSWTVDIDSLVSGIVRPMSFIYSSPAYDDERWEFDLGFAPAEMLVRLPIAIHKAGVSLTGLDIESYPPEGHFAPATSDREYEELTAAMQRLKSFHIRPLMARKGKHRDFRTSEEYRSLEKYVSAVLDSPSLESISLDLVTLSTYYGFLAPPSRSSLFSVLKLRSGPRLEALSLEDTCLTLHGLEKLLNSSGKPMFFTGRRLQLQQGCWADALDVLREKVVPESALEQCDSAEFEHMSYEQKKYLAFTLRKKNPVFDCYVYSNKLEDYIREKTAENPIRNLPGTIFFDQGVWYI